MCNPHDDSLDGYCERFNFRMALDALAHNQTTEDQHGVVYVRQQFILNLMKEYEECSI